MSNGAPVCAEKADRDGSVPERRRSYRRRRCLKASWRLLGARDHRFTPATVQDISRHGVALIVQAACKEGAILSIQLEGVAEQFAGPWLGQVENVRPLDGANWVIGCALSTDFGEGELEALLQSACALPPARSGAEPPRTPQKSSDPFLQGMGERRSAPRRGGGAITVVIARANARATRVQGSVTDRSLGGLGLAVPCPLGVGSIIKVRVAHVSEAIPWTPVRVKNCRPSRRQWIVGCEFIESVPSSVLLSFC